MRSVVLNHLDPGPYRLALDCSPALVWISDTDDSRTYLNRAWLAWTGRPHDEEAGFGWLEGVHPDDRARYMALRDRPERRGRAFTVEFRLRRSGGEYGWVHEQCAPIVREDGVLLGYTGAGMDVDERRDSTAWLAREGSRLAAANARLERQNAELEEFASVASHDLKEPLRGIHNYASFVLEDAADRLDEESVTRLESVRRLAQRSERLIDAMLHVGRLSRAEFRPRPINLGDLVRGVVGSLGDVLRDCHAEVQIDSLPRVIADPDRLAEVFMHLIVNAATFSDRPSRTIRIGSSELLPDGRVPVFVEDDGLGIPERHRETVFRMFKRLHPRDRYGGGAGAGLTACRRIIERHGGTMWIREREGGGARINLTLERATERTWLDRP